MPRTRTPSWPSSGVQDGVPYVCPARTRLRSWQALSEFRASLPEVVAGAFVPLAVIENAENALEKWLVEHPELRSHVQTVTYQMPLRWLMLVDPAERELVLGPRFDRARPTSRGGRRAGGAAAPRCVYVTTMAQARRRAARALNVVRRTIEDGPVVAGVEAVARWLEEFHPHSLVELDYGGLVHLFERRGADRRRVAGAGGPGAASRSRRATPRRPGRRTSRSWRTGTPVQQFETVN